jgi:hypothetical protein
MHSSKDCSKEGAAAAQFLPINQRTSFTNELHDSQRFVTSIAALQE